MTSQRLQRGQASRSGGSFINQVHRKLLKSISFNWLLVCCLKYGGNLGDYWDQSGFVLTVRLVIFWWVWITTVSLILSPPASPVKSPSVNSDCQIMAVKSTVSPSLSALPTLCVGAQLQYASSWTFMRRSHTSVCCTSITFYAPPETPILLLLVSY